MIILFYNFYSLPLILTMSLVILKHKKDLLKTEKVSCNMAPTAGLEPATNRLTADCSTTELSRNNTLEAGTGIEPISKDLQSSA